jgi:TusA-related sulfurtransferase
MDDKPSYTIGNRISSDSVPNWARRPPKWSALIEVIMTLHPGESLEVVFESEAAAKQARNTIRDTINLKLDTAAIRTRVVQNEGSTTVYFTRLKPADIVER